MNKEDISKLTQEDLEFFYKFKEKNSKISIMNYMKFFSYFALSIIGFIFVVTGYSKITSGRLVFLLLFSMALLTISLKFKKNLKRKIKNINAIELKDLMVIEGNLKRHAIRTQGEERNFSVNNHETNLKFIGDVILLAMYDGKKVKAYYSDQYLCFVKESID